MECTSLTTLGSLDLSLEDDEGVEVECSEPVFDVLSAEGSLR